MQEIDAGELLDEIDDDNSGLSTKPDTTWYVQVEPGNVKALSAEQLRDFYRLGVINRETYLWQPEAQQWVPLSTFVGEENQGSSTSSADDKWDVLMGPGDVRHLSLEQLDDFYRLGVIDGQTLVWQAGMTAWTKLVELVGEDEDDDEDDVWYAQMPSGEVKQLTLEQLDDFYRVDVISERTPVWKEGMNQWLPLGTVAGIAEPSPAPVTPIRVAAQPGAVAASPVASPIKVSPIATSPVAIAAKPVSAAPMPVLSAPPLVTTVAPPERASTGGKWLLRLSIAAGLFAVLLRNDVLFSAAQASRQQGSYLQLEQQTLGGPAFGTMRAVEQLVAETGGDLAPVRLPWLVQESQARSAKEAAAVRSSVTPPPAAPAVQTQPPVNSPPAQPKAEAKVQPSAPAANMAAAAQSTLGSHKKAAKVKAMPRASTGRKAGSKGKAGVFSTKGDAFDPLNGAM